MSTAMRGPAGPVAGVLWVSAGPDAGTPFLLGSGHHDIARRPDVSIGLTDQEIHRRGSARLVVSDSGELTVEDLGSAHGVFIDGMPIPGPGSGRHPRQAAGAVPLLPRARLQVGATTLQWFPQSAAASARPLHQPLGSLLVSVPAALADGATAPLARLSRLVPAAERVLRQRRAAEIARQRSELRASIERFAVQESARRHEQAPGPAELLLATLRTGADDGRAAGADRSADAPGDLVLRAGTADQPAHVVFDRTPVSGLDVPALHQVPVTVDLRAAGSLAIVGAPAGTRDLARWLIVQLAVLRAPGDLSLMVIGDGLGFAHSLPQVAEVGGATTLARLRELIASRTSSAASPASSGPASSSPVVSGDVVVIVDDATALRDAPGMKELLNDGPAAGVHSICLGSEPVPEAGAEIRILATSAGPTQLLISQAGAEPVTAQPDVVTEPVADQITGATGISPAPSAPSESHALAGPSASDAAREEQPTA